MKKLSQFVLWTSLILPSLSIADNHDAHSKDKSKCECTKECKDNCKAGKSKDCSCKSCECTKGKECH